jgi:ribosomal-protein-alanine N-acetyltransferase
MLQLNFTPFPELQTERLLIRRLVQQDAPELFFLRSDAQVLQYVGREPATSLEDITAFIQRIDDNIAANQSILWAIELLSDPGRLIGSICYWQVQFDNFRAEIGYNLHPDHWGKGIITEAIRKVVDYGFGVMKLHSIEARFHPNNTGSGRALEKAGFRKEGYLREEFFFRGVFHDSVIYSLLAKDLEHAPPGR